MVKMWRRRLCLIVISVYLQHGMIYIAHSFCLHSLILYDNNVLRSKSAVMDVTVYGAGKNR